VRRVLKQMRRRARERETAQPFPCNETTTPMPPDELSDLLAWIDEFICSRMTAPQLER
jgi:hypothetical protein